MKDKENDEIRRQEINLFSAMATGGSIYTEDTASNEFAIKNKTTPCRRYSEGQKRRIDTESFSTTTTAKSQDESKNFSEIARSGANSGTFTTSISSDHSDSNLQLAAASLAGTTEKPTVETVSSSPIIRMDKQKKQKIKSINMHSERVILQRPLFFGPVLPPRVLRETREILRHVSEEDTFKDSFSCKKLPRHVCNLISTIESFGFGLSPYPSTKSNIEDEMNPSYYTGNSCVTTYQPVWGDTARTDRRTSLKKQRCSVQTNRMKTEKKPTSMPFDRKPKLGVEQVETVSTMKKYSSSSQPETPKSDIQIFVETTKEDEPNISSSSSSFSEITTDSSAWSIIQSPMNDKNLFSQFARGELPSNGSGVLTGGSFINSKSSSIGPTSLSDDKARFSNLALDGEKGETGKTNALVNNHESNRKDNEDALTLSADAALFSQLASGELASHDNALDSSYQNKKRPPSDTFRFVQPISDDSDDDSVVGSELKKKVGQNENLETALNYFQKDQALPSGSNDIPMASSESISVDESQTLLSQLGQTTKGGRPLTNLELTGGCVPLFSCDDPSLPSESDLGIFETKDDQEIDKRQRRNKEIVEKHTMPDVFGSIACPNPAAGPDDNHSSNLRTVPNKKTSPNNCITTGLNLHLCSSTPTRKGPTTSNTFAPKYDVDNTVEPTIPVPPALHKTPTSPLMSKDAFIGKPPRRSMKTQTSLPSSRYGSATRYGWWNIEGENSKSENFTKITKECPLVKARVEHSTDGIQINTGLEPSQLKLREENLPLSRMHPATSTASCLPFLSDRPPSWRYLQIDTKAIGFPPLGGEIEPLFCSLAIYHVETNATSGSDHGSVPSPNLPKCGRVTEILHFDVITDKDVERRCFGALWPYYNKAAKGHVAETERTQGTRCGIFPLPSNLNIANLYAILVIQKVLSSKHDANSYITKVEIDGKNASSRNNSYDKEKYRERAQKASNRQGQFLMPFAFGVTPLLQVFKTDVPTVPISRAVQIPLFHFTASPGEGQIIDHIMVMLYPRADHKSAGISGPAPLTNGGTAMLVMRYFGYLGLHSVVHSKSSLARHRLVDFTAELQLRQKEENEDAHEGLVKDQLRSERDYVVNHWGNTFISEPTKFSGRNVVQMLWPNSEDSEVTSNMEENLTGATHTTDIHASRSSSTLYAQELATIPLQVSPSTGRIPASPVRMNRGRSGIYNSDSEPHFYTSFCNELLCNLRQVHNCPKGNIVTKVELREVEWMEEINSHVARLPAGGPYLHNQRRGPPFVNEAFSSCIPSSSTINFRVNFLDEFKIKLPLLLSDPAIVNRRLVLFFSVYHVEIKRKKTWTERGAKVLSKHLASLYESDSNMKAPLELLGCGFLPITTNSETNCLLNNGLHDVKLCYDAKLDHERKNELLLTPKETEKNISIINGIEDESTASLCEQEIIGNEVEDDYTLNEGEAINGSVHSRAETASSDITSLTDQPLKSSSSALDQMSLQIRIIVHSSIHPQNATLNEFLQNQPLLPIPLSFPRLPSESPWTFERDKILKYIETQNLAGSTEIRSDRAQKLIRNVVDICKPSLCSATFLSSHFVRIMKQLLFIMVSGTGDPSILWANPASVLPLRINAFATLMQLLYVVSNHLSKFGLTQLDGKNKFNSIIFGRILSLFFDEENIFSEQGHAVEPLDLDEWASMSPGKTNSRPKTIQRKSSGPRRGHVRSDSDSLIFPAETTGSRTQPQLMVSQGADVRRASKKDAGKWKSPSTSAEQVLSPPDFTSNIRLSEKASIAWTQQKVDSKHNLYDNIFSGTGNVGNVPSSAQGLSGRRKFMTLPSNALATIREDNDPDNIVCERVLLSRSSSAKIVEPCFNNKGKERERLDAVHFKTSATLDPELVRKPSRNSVKKMRVPKVGGSPGAVNEKPNVIEVNTILMDDDAIETAGTAFLDAFGKNLGYSSPRIGSGEEQRVGHSHHRKTRSKCSIDWTLPDDDLLLERGQSLELESSILSFTDTNAQGSMRDRAREDEMSDNLTMDVLSLKLESENTKKIPSYLERILLLKKYNKENGRWFPYVYEVIIFQWVAILKEQHRSGDRKGSNSEYSQAPDDDLSTGRDDEEILRNAATRACGFAVSCAPALLEIIKKSLGFRLHILLRQADRLSSKSSDAPPLVHLDANVLKNLESLISMITDACIDCRNFDTREFQQTSIDVNDSVVLFLRDLFSFLDPECVHRLILVYFSRFVVKDGKQWQDRDSKIGIKCSWELCKMRLNAVTVFVRFPDFIRVNSPQMTNWNTLPMKSHSDATKSFFDQSLENYFSLGLPAFVAPDGPNTNAQLNFPRMKPHWLAELVVDICLAGTDHAEQKIQHRASSLLHELFWCNSIESKVAGTSTIVASMYVSFLLKILNHISYLSCLGAKTQLRKDLMPCVIFILQCAPTGLLRSLWRKLCFATQGEGNNEKYGPVPNVNRTTNIPTKYDSHHDPNILDMFSLLNIALATFEYEGCEDKLDCEDMREDDDLFVVWGKEYLVAMKEPHEDASIRRAPIVGRYQDKKAKSCEPTYSTSNTRKWHSHDGSLVIINSCRYIVRELLSMLEPNKKRVIDFGPQVKNRDFRATNSNSDKNSADRISDLNFSDADKVVFVRAASSVYLHSLSLKESDIVITKTLTAAVELVKIFGINYFLDAVGETLQHWMRVVTIYCGARRAFVRLQASEFLALILRMTWDTYGSFFRIRLPLLAVQTEVMEKLVVTAAARYYREQRSMSASIQYLSNDSAEASLSMLWRTLDRLHNQPASTNQAYKSALQRLAQKMKNLYKAYIAAHALSILKRARLPSSPGNDGIQSEDENIKLRAFNQRRRISVHRIVTASAGYCKQFLGAHKPVSQDETVAHNEAVEDAFLDAADVFSSTELPFHRVAWLQKLADFHATRRKYAEGATCHYQIQLTFKQASRLHEKIWSSAPFLPWTEGGVHIDGEGPAGEPDEYYDNDEFDALGEEEEAANCAHYGRQVDKTNAFRRIFYRVANSVRMGTGDWEISGNKHVFYGVSHVSEFGSSKSWIPIREMEERMIESSESAGELYLKAGIAESSRVAWGLATSYYAVRYNYPKLTHAYRRLSLVVSSQVPVVDANEHALDFSHPIGRFYKVFFHGGAPDELIGAEFVYRAPSSVKLQDFGNSLSRVIRNILPDNNSIDLVLDDGRPEEPNWRSNQRRAVGPSTLEPVKIKITPLRALLRKANEIRGTPEWFRTYIETPRPGFIPFSQESTYGFKKIAGDGTRSRSSKQQKQNHMQSYSASMFTPSGFSSSHLADNGNRILGFSAHEMNNYSKSDDLVGVDKFSFLQPIRRDRNRQSRDWLKASGDFTEKNLRVTHLQVEKTFPACVARQKVVNRSVFKQSPLEAGVDALCTWCSVLFRTAVATNGMIVLGKRTEHGIGSAAAKVVADCIHSSRVKEMGITLLKNHKYVAEEGENEYGTFDKKRISEEEVRMLQIKLARCLVVFIELLHLLISRNRDLLLAVVEARKARNNHGSSVSSRPGSSRDPSVGSPAGRKTRYSSIPAAHIRTPSNPTHSRVPSNHSYLSNSNSIDPPKRTRSEPISHARESSKTTETPKRVRKNNGATNTCSGTFANDKTDSAIAVQSELQRAFISMSKALYPNIFRILESETPRWLKQCSQDNYFSSYTYRETSIPMTDEVCFFSGQEFTGPFLSENDTESLHMTSSVVSSTHLGHTSLKQNAESFSAGSLTEGSTISRGSQQRPLQHRKGTSSDSISLKQV